MKRLWSLLLIAALCATGATAQSLDGKKIHLKAGDTKSVATPISLKCDAPTPDGVITVVDEKTQKACPATLRNGELVFIAEGAMPGTEHDYVVKVEKKADGYTPHVVIKKQEDKEILDVIIDDVHFTSFHYSKEWKKPFLWPILSTNQVGLTRDYPMQPEGTPKFATDHPHHKSLWVAYGDINGADCWGEGDKAGYQRNLEVSFGSGDAYGWIIAKNVWQNNAEEPVTYETREYRFFATPEKGRLLDAYVTFKNDERPIVFKDTKEGGIVAVRVRPEMIGARADITNALGDKGEKECWGKPSPWCDYSAKMRKLGSYGIAVFDYPENPRFPTSWHVRRYGLMGANCFGYSYFSEKDYNKDLLPSNNGDLTVEKGEELNFHHRIYVHEGNAEDAAVADRYADFATPPQAQWVE